MIHLLEANDLEQAAQALAALLREPGLFPRLESETEETTHRRVRERLAWCQAGGDHSVWIAEDPPGTIAGYCSVHWLPYLILPGPEGFVSELFVAGAARGKGLGAALLEAVREEAAARGCSRLSLLAMRGRESYRRGFYPKHGWTEHAEAANFILPVEA